MCTWVGVLALVVLAPATASAQWYSTYEDARQAVARASKSGAARDWREAERLLGQAVDEATREGVEPGRNLQVYGMRFMHFVPDYYLGLVYTATGRLAEAERAFTSAKRLVSSKDREFRDVDDRANRVALDLAKRPAPSTRQGEVPGKAEPPVTIAEAPSRDVPITQGPPAPTPAQGQATTPTTTEPSKKPSPEPADVTPAPAGSGVSTEPSKAPSRPVLVIVPNVLGVDVNSARRRLAGSALSVGSAGTVDSRRAPGTVISQSPAAGVRVAAGARVSLLYAVAPPSLAPDPEQIAVRAFFAGDYQDAIRTLAPLAAGRNPPARVRFYLACAYAARSILVPAERPRLLQAAQEQYRLVRADEKRLVRDRRYISPRILELLEPAADVY
jgi:hypothetical protein